MTKQAFIAHFIAVNWNKYREAVLVSEANKAWAVYDSFLKHG